MLSHKVMDVSGHSTITFDEKNVVDREAAMKRFAELTTKGYAAAKTVAPGQHQQVRKFEEADLVFVPPLQAG